MKLVVIIPAYNEEETIAKVIKEIPRKIPGIDFVQILVIDDGSTDKTVEVAKKAGADKIISHKTNLGLGVAVSNGLQCALKMNAGIIVNIDADGQYNAKEIPKLIKPLLEDKAEIVLGYRNIANLDFMPLSKRIGNKIATWVTRRVSNLPIKDAQTGFRAFSKEAALRLNLSGGYTYVQETLIQARDKGLTVVQIPIEFREREGSSRLISNPFSYAKKAGIIIIRSYRDRTPLKVFLYIGSIFLIIGLIFGLRVLINFLKTGTVSPYIPSAIIASMLIVISFVIFVLGLIADMLKTNRKLQEEILYKIKRQEIEKK